MQGTFIVWIMFLLVAVVLAILLGILCAFVPQDTKRWLKSFEIERGYDGDIKYQGCPTVVITERFDARINTLAVAAILTIAWGVFVLGGTLVEVCGGDVSLLRIVVGLAVSLVGHLIIWLVLSACSYRLMALRALVLRKEYERRRAEVDVNLCNMPRLFQLT